MMPQVLEVVDTSGVALKDLLHRVNECWSEICEKSDGKKFAQNYYKIVVSPRIGKTKSKEQCAFFYRANRFQVPVTTRFIDANPCFPFLLRSCEELFYLVEHCLIAK